MIKGMISIISTFHRWMLTALIAAIGLFFLCMTYGALIQSYKNRGTDRYSPSGVPCVGGLILIIAFLISPCKWLAFLVLLDYGIWEVPYLLIKEFILKKRNKK